MEAVPGGGLSACSVQGSGSLMGPRPRRGLRGTLGFSLERWTSAARALLRGWHFGDRVGTEASVSVGDRLSAVGTGSHGRGGTWGALV